MRIVDAINTVWGDRKEVGRQEMSQCNTCGSTDPHITIGWPVCPNEDFHEQNQPDWATRFWSWRHRVLWPRLRGWVGKR